MSELVAIIQLRSIIILSTSRLSPLLSLLLLLSTMSSGLNLDKGLIGHLELIGRIDGWMDGSTIRYDTSELRQ